MKANKNLKKTLMWYKINELKQKGLNKSQISYELGISRKTVRKYQGMNCEEFQCWVNQSKNLPLKLKGYFEFVRQLLEEHPYLSSAQIEDRMKEHFEDLPLVHSKTIYNFVQHVRHQAQIPKPSKNKVRDFEQLPQLGYGQEAQVDFGECFMKDKQGKRVKVWLFVMVLSRSRQKYVYFQDYPFTTATAIYAHQKAFEYFQGVPRRIIYDQDRVFMVDENLGDLLLTSGFEHYVRSESFEAVFCRKSDPQSKGKVENVVKYVKDNFVKGRTFSGMQGVNDAVLGWLWRTGNGKVHSATRLIPHQEWLKEKNHLLPVHNKPYQADTPEFIHYKVRKDNTITYKGNYYSLPVGTYKNQQSTVLLNPRNNKLDVYDLNKNLLATHTVSTLKGRYISISDHRRDKSQTLGQRKQEAINRLGGNAKALEFVEAIARSKPRYFNDNLRTLLSRLKTPDKQVLDKALDYCLNNQVFNSMRLIEIIAHYQQSALQKPELQETLNGSTLPLQAHQVPQTSKINTYQKILAL
jgi:transposase